MNTQPHYMIDHSEPDEQKTTSIPVNGTIRSLGEKQCIYYEGQWVRYYEPIPDTLASKKQLIDNLKKRLFHHTENGINTPGFRLEMAREAYEKQTDPAKKRVNGAMLAGALFNRAADIFTALVELEEKGITISTNDELMVMCGECFAEALELGRTVKHYSGEEGIDELWGEPFKVFTMSIPDYYASRYLKVAKALNNIDEIIGILITVFEGDTSFEGIEAKLKHFKGASHCACETMKVDPEFFNIWPLFVTASEQISDFQPLTPPMHDTSNYRRVRAGCHVLEKGRQLIEYISNARVPMPSSTKNFAEDCDRYKQCCKTGLWEKYWRL